MQDDRQQYIPPETLEQANRIYLENIELRRERDALRTEVGRRDQKVADLRAEVARLTKVRTT